MKIFLLALVVLIGVNYASAQVDSAEALRVQSEAKAYINLLETWADSKYEKFGKSVTALTNNLISPLTSAKSILNASFKILGSGAKAQRSIWLSGIDDLVNTLKNQLSSGSIDAILLPSVGALRAAYIDPRYPEIENLKTAINAHVTLAACWDKNSKAIKSLVDKVIAEAKTIIDNETSSLKKTFTEISANIKSKIDSFNNDLKGCATDGDCIYKYIQANYDKLLSDIKTQTDAASKALETSIGNISGQVDAAAKAIEAEYKAGPKAKIDACVAKG